MKVICLAVLTVLALIFLSECAQGQLVRDERQLGLPLDQLTGGALGALGLGGGRGKRLVDLGGLLKGVTGAVGGVTNGLLGGRRKRLVDLGGLLNGVTGAVGGVTNGLLGGRRKRLVDLGGLLNGVTGAVGGLTNSLGLGRRKRLVGPLKGILGGKRKRAFDDAEYM